MSLSSRSSTSVARVLNQCCSEVKPTGPWQWQCVTWNGARMSITARFEDGFLSLVCPIKADGVESLGLERALRANRSLGGGVKFALDPTRFSVDLRADIPVIDDRQLLSRLPWSLGGFHDGIDAWMSSSIAQEKDSWRASAVFSSDLRELTRETGWSVEKRGENAYTVALDAESAPPATLRASQDWIDASVELARAKSSDRSSRRALAVYLLAATGSLRFARAYSAESDDEAIFGFLAGLPAAPAAEEVDHAFSALSVAYRTCAREVNVLLNEEAASCYLDVRGPSNDHHLKNEKENCNG
jgi:hypothetical protein